MARPPRLPSEGASNTVENLKLWLERDVRSHSPDAAEEAAPDTKF